MRRTLGLLVLPLAWFAVGCVDGGVGDEGAGAGRDLMTMTAEFDEGAVASDLELGRTTAAPEAAFTAGPVPAPEAVSEITQPVQVLVVFTDGLDLASEPQVIEASLPILGAGSGTMLRPGATVVAMGDPMDLFQPTERGDSPWPEARPGEFPAVDRDGISLVVGRGGHGGRCPAPGMHYRREQTSMEISAAGLERRRFLHSARKKARVSLGLSLCGMQDRMTYDRVMIF